MKPRGYMAPNVDIVAYARAYIDADEGVAERRRSMMFAMQTAPQREAQRKADAQAAIERAARAMGMA